MSDKEYTRFKLSLPQFSIELSGERAFVEKLYEKIYRDLLPVIEGKSESTPSPMPKPKKSPFPVDVHYTWVYNCTPHYKKVYVVDNQAIWHTPYGRFIDPRRLQRIFVYRDQKSQLFQNLSAGNRTLWAEITPEGRRMIEEAAKQREKERQKKRGK